MTLARIARLVEYPVTHLYRIRQEDQWEEFGRENARRRSLSAYLGDARYENPRILSRVRGVIDERLERVDQLSGQLHKLYARLQESVDKGHISQLTPLLAAVRQLEGLRTEFLEMEQVAKYFARRKQDCHSPDGGDDPDLRES